MLWSVPGGVVGPDWAACTLSECELHAETQQVPSRVSSLHKGHFPPTESPCVLRAFTSSSLPEALHEGCSRLGGPHLTQWDPHPPPEAPILLPSF